MNTLSAKTIALNRINYGESDRIVTFITEEGSKITLLTKGVRKIKSKLAGGIELFCVSEIVYITGKSKLGTLTSSRVFKNYNNIVKDIDRTMFGYEILKLVNRITEDEELKDFFDLVNVTLDSLNDLDLNLGIIKIWSYFQLLYLSGHSPNIYTDKDGKKLKENQNYIFDYISMNAVESSQGTIDSSQIKLLRIIEKSKSPKKIIRIKNIDNIKLNLSEILTKMIKYNL